MIEIFDRNGYKYVKIPRPRGSGPAIEKSLGTKSIEEARQRVKDAQLEKLALADHADVLTAEVWTRMIAGKNIRVRDAVAAFREHRVIIGRPNQSIVKEQQVLDAFLRFTGLANEPLALLDTRQVAEFVNQPGDQMLPTRVGWLQLINTFLTYCVEKRWIVRNPAVEVVVRLEGLTQQQLVSNPHRAFTEAEVRGLLVAIPRTSFWHGAVLFGYHFGLRLGAVATLEETNIVANVLRLYTTKGQRIVNERLPDEIIEWLAEWAKVRPASDLPHLFPAEAASYLGGPAHLSKQFKRILVKHGLPDHVFHGLRKTATNRRWSAELDQLGDRDKRALMALVAQHGFRKTQEMLAHAPGSDVTEKFYMPKAP